MAHLSRTISGVLGAFVAHAEVESEAVDNDSLALPLVAAGGNTLSFRADGKECR